MTFMNCLEDSAFSDARRTVITVNFGCVTA
jgi:hypothetical protein